MPTAENTPGQMVTLRGANGETVKLEAVDPRSMIPQLHYLIDRDHNAHEAYLVPEGTNVPEFPLEVVDER